MPARSEQEFTRRRKATAFAVSVILCIVLAATQVACTRREPPNLVLITLDTLRSDRLSAYGHPVVTSPTLDALALRGVLFQDAVSQSTATTPSHASILTGQNPPTHGLHRLYGQRLPQANVTLAEILENAGYTTAAFVSAVPLRSDTGLDQGFDVYDDSWESATKHDQHQRAAEETNRSVFEWLDTKPGTPLFLWVHYFDPHFPYFPPENYRRRFGVNKVVREFLPRPIDAAARPRRKPPAPALVKKMSALYDAEIAYTDAAIASLLDQLERRGLSKTTAIAVVGDHGELLGEYGYFFGHWGVTDETARVPMILVHPEGRFADTVVSTAVGAIDLVPTLLAWLGIDPVVHFDGRDLTPMLEGEPIEPRALYTEQFEFFPVRAVRNGEWILEQRAARNAQIATGPRVLYRRHANGFARHPSSSHPGIADSLGAQMDAVLSPPIEHSSENLDDGPDIRSQLRALGYTDDAQAPEPQP